MSSGSPSSALVRRHEAPVVRIGEACQQRLAKGKSLKLGIVGEFRAAAARRFDNDVDVAVVSKGWQVKKNRHVTAPERFDAAKRPDLR